MKKVIGTVMIAVTTLLVVTAETLINDNKFTVFTRVVSRQMFNEANSILLYNKQTKENGDCCEIIVQATKLPTFFNVTLRNKGKEAIYISERTPAKVFEIEIRDAKGQVVPKIIVPKKEGTISVDEGRLVMRIIKPNEEKTYILDISKMYKLSSGEFIITFKRAAILEDGKKPIEIVSKPMKFSVSSKLKKSRQRNTDD